MLQKHIIVFILACLSLTSCAQAGNKQETGLLWKISGNKLEQPSYLFGTHHLVQLSYLENIDGVEEAFMATEQTVGEVDMKIGRASCRERV